MRSLKLCFLGYIFYISIELIVFIFNTAINHKAINNFLGALWIPNLILWGIIICIGTYGYLSVKFRHLYKVVIIILSITVTVIEMGILFGMAFILAMLVVAPILTRYGFYVPMP